MADLYENLEPNSHKYKKEKEAAARNERKPLQPIVKAHVQKRTGIAKILNSERTQKLFSYAWLDVIKPGAKRIISEVFDAVLYPDGNPNRSRRRNDSYYVSYDKSYRSNEHDRYRRDDRQESRKDRLPYGFKYEDPVVYSKEEAIDLIDKLDEILDRYEFVSILDLYELADMTDILRESGGSVNWNLDKYGWKDLRHIGWYIVGRDEYVIKMPKIVPRD